MRLLLYYYYLEETTSKTNMVKQDLVSTCKGFRTSISIPKAHPTDTEEDRRQMKIRTWRPEAQKEKDRQAVQEVFFFFFLRSPAISLGFTTFG